MQAKLVITDKNGKVFEGHVELLPVTSRAASSKAQPPKTGITQTEQFRGPSGGVRLLLSRGLFSSPRKVRDVRDALAKEGYHYGGAQVQTALNRLSERGGPLVTSRHGGKKMYVKRK